MAAYVVLRELGRGGMGIVYLVEEKKTRKKMAMKVSKCVKEVEDQSMVEHLLWEASLLGRLNHPMIPKLIDFFYEDGRYFIVMEYIEGVTMSEYITTYKRIEEKKLMKYGIQLAGVLQYLHTQTPMIIYRDIKPDNIMIRKDGTIQLIDYGIALEGDADENGKVKDHLGTYRYAAPEQFLDNEKYITRRSDIYSLGVLLHDMSQNYSRSSGKNNSLFEGNINKNTSKRFSQIIKKCMEVKPEERYQTGKSLQKELKKSYVLSELKNVWYQLEPVFLFVMLLISAGSVGMGVEGYFIEKWSSYEKWIIAGLVFVIITEMMTSSTVWRLLWKKIRIEDYETKVAWYQKRVEMFTVLVLCMILISMLCNMIGGTLPVMIQDQRGRNILIKQNGVFYTKEDIIIKLPDEKEEIYQVSIENQPWYNLKSRNYKMKVELLLNKGQTVQMDFRGVNFRTKELRMHRILICRD